MRSIFCLLTIIIIPVCTDAQSNSIVEWQRVSFEEMRGLIVKAKEDGKSKLADSITQFYKLHYLDTLNDTLLFTKDNLQFMASFIPLIHSSDRIFKFYHEKSDKADQIIGGRVGYARSVIKYIISEEEIDTFLYRNDEVLTFKPSWKRMYRSIKRKYDPEYASEIVGDAKFNYYRKIENWKQFARCFEERIRKWPPTKSSNLLGGGFGDSWTLNATAWDVFLNCNDNGVLKKAVNWVSLGITLCNADVAYQFLDTKANLLFKIGKNREAVQYEERALALDKQSKSLQATLSNMMQGKPTWPSK